MFIIRLFRWLFGYVAFEGGGGFPERFVNLCRVNGTELWDLHSADGHISGKMTVGAYRRIRKPAFRSGMHIHIVSRHGLPFILHAHADRKGLLAGAVIGFALIWVLSSFIWVINVKGNELFTEEQILEMCACHGIHIGTFTKSIRVAEVQNEITAEHDDIFWFAVNICGSSISAEVMEMQKKPEMNIGKDPCNIISTEDGELVRLDVLEGAAAADRGAPVKKGQLLISGAVSKEEPMRTSFVHARGNVGVRCRKNIHYCVSPNDPMYVPADVKSLNTLYFFGLKIPLGIIAGGDDGSVTGSYVETDTAVLPIGLITRRSWSFSPCNTASDENRELLLACRGYFMLEREMMKTSETESMKIDYTVENGIVTVSGDYTSVVDAGKEQPFEIAKIE